MHGPSIDSSSPTRPRCNCTSSASLGAACASRYPSHKSRRASIKQCRYQDNWNRTDFRLCITFNSRDLKMSNPYEVEHNIKPSSAPSTRHRRVDMSTFTAHLSNTLPTEPNHQNPHAIANPTDISALFRLLQDQFGTLAADAPTQDNRSFLESLINDLEEDILHPPREMEGVSQEFLDTLDRVDRKKLKDDAKCPICGEVFLDDKYCLVVELPCHKSHQFDLECVAPWLQSKGNCPMCRAEFGKKKEVSKQEDEDDEDDTDGLYA
ncbi:hypothetical protein QBC44DRAFT_319464 [Cladorrhinum sp. PSN332]|nr:hypothetical protein QBC44DRAFT_319464 [Cladorrhinum sp. PSN332]